MTATGHQPRRQSAVWLLLFTLFFSLGGVSAFALDISKLQPQGYVSDFAGVVDVSSKTQVESYLTRLKQATGVEVAVVTVDTLDGDPIEDVANSLYRKWGIGVKGQNEGALLLLAVRDRKSRVEVGYGLEPVMPDGFAGSVLREMRPSLQEGAYGQALLAGTARIGEAIAKAKGVTLDRTLTRRNTPRRNVGDGGGIPWPLVIVGIVILLGLLGRGGGSGGGLAWFLLGNILGSGTRYRGGGWGGGGFGGGGGGGGDSGGGGFGGFGGGDSGGGGASGSW